ncbi:hypothetical protein Tco_1370012 [Tanacetum coccineum]
MVKSWLVQDQTVLGKDYSNLLIADSLLKTIWFINAPCYGNEALASPKANELTIPEQTATGKGTSNPFMADKVAAEDGKCLVILKIKKLLKRHEVKSSTIMFRGRIVYLQPYYRHTPFQGKKSSSSSRPSIDTPKAAHVSRRRSLLYFSFPTSELTFSASTHLRNLYISKKIPSRCRYQVYTLGSSILPSLTSTPTILGLDTSS